MSKNGKCSKCSSDVFGGSYFTENGNAFLFCKECSDLLGKAPTGGAVEAFLGQKKVESWIQKNIREAREKREMDHGKSVLGSPST
jgi:hypothetical protein